MTQRPVDAAQRADALYRAFWRWHFYAALVVIPYLLLAAASGALMLVSKPLDERAQQALRVVAPDGRVLPASVQAQGVAKRFPDRRIALYIPPRVATESARFAIADHGHGQGSHGGGMLTVFVDPYRGEVLGTLDSEHTLYARVKAFHGTLFLGRSGEILVEVAAGLSLLLVCSGLCLALPRLRPGAIPARPGEASRARWQRLHRRAGLAIALPLGFFLLSGLAWTGIWGGQLVQPWNSVPGTRFEPEPPARPHASQNHAGVHAVPWALEQTPLPLAQDTGFAARELTIDKAVAIARRAGFDRFRIHLPAEEGGVWTISATTMAGDILNPLLERTLHLDPQSGAPLREIRFADYPAVGQAMAAGIPLHQGDLGAWNIALNLALCAAVLFMALSGVAMWWRRPRAAGLSPPPAPRSSWRLVFAGMFAVAVLFPLSAVALLGIAALDWLLPRRQAAR